MFPASKLIVRQRRKPSFPAYTALPMRYRRCQNWKFWQKRWVLVGDYRKPIRIDCKPLQGRGSVLRDGDGKLWLLIGQGYEWSAPAPTEQSLLDSLTRKS